MFINKFLNPNYFFLSVATNVPAADAPPIAVPDMTPVAPND